MVMVATPPAIIKPNDACNEAATAGHEPLWQGKLLAGAHQNPLDVGRLLSGLRWSQGDP